MKLKEWIRERKQAVGFAAAILVAEIWPLFTSEHPMTAVEWHDHTLAVLLAAAMLALLINLFPSKKE